MYLPSLKSSFMLGLLFLTPFWMKGINITGDSTTFYDIHQSGFKAIYQLQGKYQAERSRINQQLQWLALQLVHRTSADQKVELLEEKLELLDALSRVENAETLEMLKVRYGKGIDLIRVMYEKILGLDHHFSSMQTYQNVAVLSNPNTFPAFKQIQGILKEKSSSKLGFSFPSIWESNAFLTATFSIVSSLLGKGRSEEKSAEINEISCVLDFTLRMHGDLNIVRHETEFLKKANQALKEECEALFKEYTLFLDYLVPLADCRKNDDWEQLQEQLLEFMGQLQNESTKNVQEAKKKEVDLAFATQRVADFITKYSNFIQQGIQYYQKFDSIISSYENEATCAPSLPHQFQELKYDIKTTIEKFNNTYNLPEIQGSRLKSLLYGGIN